MPAGEADERVDAFLDRRVRREEIGEARARVVDAHRHEARRHARELALAGYLHQGRDHRVGVLGQLDGARVGEVLARTRQREADHQRERPGERDQRQRDQDRDEGAAAALLRIRTARRARGRRAAPARHHVEPAEDELAEERDHAGDDDRGDHHAHVLVADVRQLVPQHRLELGVVERGEKPAGDGDRVLLLAEAGREGVEAVGVHDLQARHRHAAGDAEVLEQIVEARIILAGDPLRPRHGVDETLVEARGDPHP